MNKFARVAGRLFNVPLMLRPEKAEMFVAALAERMGVAKLDKLDGTSMGVLELRQQASDYIENDRPSRRLYKLKDGIAVIPMDGTLVHKLGGVDPWSGMIGYDQLDKKIEAAREDRDVRGILLDMDSPGGETSGCFELAKKIHAGSARFGGKPIFAVANEMSCSAAYAIASACDRIAMPETGVAGSIGVWTMLVDLSKALGENGIEVRLIRAGERKARGHPYEEHDDETVQKLQDWVDETRLMFANLVATCRGLSVDAVLAQEGDWFTGDHAMEMGLVDAIASPDEVFEVLRKEAAAL